MPRTKTEHRVATRQRLDLAAQVLASKLDNDEIPPHRTEFFQTKLRRMVFQLRRLESLTARRKSA